MREVKHLAWAAGDNLKSTLYKVKHKYKVKSPHTSVQTKTLPPGYVQTQITDVGVADKLLSTKLTFRLSSLLVSTET